MNPISNNTNVPNQILELQERLLEIQNKIETLTPEEQILEVEGQKNFDTCRQELKQLQERTDLLYEDLGTVEEIDQEVLFKRPRNDAHNDRILENARDKLKNRKRSCRSR